MVWRSAWTQASTSHAGRASRSRGGPSSASRPTVWRSTSAAGPARLPRPWPRGAPERGSSRPTSTSVPLPVRHQTVSRSTAAISSPRYLANWKVALDVVVGVVPYVPTPALGLLARDTLTFESPLSYDGGRDGTEILRRVLTECPRFLRRGGALLLELGGEQADVLGDDLARLGYVDVVVLVDPDDDVRGIEVTLGPRR